MKRILSSSMALACLLLASSAFSQNPTTGQILPSATPCDVIVEDFSTDPIARNFSYSGFSYSGTQTSGQTLRVATAGANTDYIVTTPSYQLISGGTIRVGFSLTSLTGSNNYFQGGNTMNLQVDVLNNEGTSTLASSTFTLTAGGTFCIQLQDGDIPTGARVKYRYIFTTSPTTNGSRQLNFDNFSSSSNQQTVLPVIFTSFTARKLTTSNQLIWNVASELNVARYEVERSANGKTWGQIGQVSAALLLSYNFTDAAPMTGANYYRIKSVDNDGRYKYSPVVQIKSSTKPTTQLKAYPTVTTTTVTLEHDEYTSGAGLQISSMDGRVVRSVIPARSVQQTQLNVTDLAPGMYMVRYTNSAGETETVKIVKH